MLLGVLGLVAGRLGVLWISFDVFAQFTLQFLAVTLSFLIGYFMPRARVLAAITLLVLCLVAIGVWPQEQSRSTAGAVSPAERALRIMSFNTRLASENGEAVAAEVLRDAPDVAILIEFGEHKRGALDKLKAAYPYQADCLAASECYMAIVAKAPFANVASRTGWEGPPLMRATLGPESGNVTVIGVHTIRFPHQRAQLRQIDALTRYLDDVEGPVIVAGDFNATPFSRLLNTFAERSRMARLTYYPSWPAWLRLPQLAIDHVFVGRGIRETETPRIGENAGSDHYPVIAEVAVSPP
jgi:endonuclease/exonuclease/phosphatase (EEP) superfamily protein YafD